MLRKGRRVATTGRSRSLLSDGDEVLLTVVYLRQVCPQKVMGDLLGVNPVTIDHGIKATRKLLDDRKISITPTVVRYFTRAEDLRAWATGSGPAEHAPATLTRQALADPTLTGMSREALHALLEELIVPCRRDRRALPPASAVAAGARAPAAASSGRRSPMTTESSPQSSTAAVSAALTLSPSCSASAEARCGTRSVMSCRSSTPATSTSLPPTTATPPQPTCSPRSAPITTRLFLDGFDESHTFVPWPWARSR
ncbi:hypothetical protein [Streptomyces aureoversilis]|uniref:hypothetical protein n=1 Tax=Streptomyces aureoversilis TaxID=67277 RepID=UPI003AA84E63